MKKCFFVLLSSVFLLSCTSDSTEPAPQLETPEVESEEKPSAAEPKDEDMVGLSPEAAEAMAKERGLKSRVVSVDGEG
ncbi:MAG: hypothetical protein AAF357_08705, partial [Verrucomicrobiota bacterium]